MLSDKSRPVIQATLPVVGAHIKDIAQCFYRHLFTTHPELLDGTFNRGNQADGTQLVSAQDAPTTSSSWGLWLSCSWAGTR